MTGRDRGGEPTHPHLQATLLMVGVVVFLIAVAVLDLR
jgi:hypothetical protein